MSYVQQSLTPSEEIVYMASVHWWVLAASIPITITAVVVAYFFGPFIALPFILMNAILIAKGLIYMLTSELAITSRRIVAKFGWISRKTFEVRTNRIEGIHVSQGILGRIFGFGTISVVGIGGSPTPIPLIANPLAFKRTADSIAVKDDA